MHSLSLHHLTVMDVPAIELVEIAAALDCAHVCLFTAGPDGLDLPIVGDGDVAPLRRRMADAGVTLLGTTYFAITADVDMATFEAGIERSARLGARHANCRIIEADEGRATESFVRFAELCAARGLQAAIEPSGYGLADAFPQALRMIAAAGRGILNLDPLHIARTGTPWDLIEAIEPAFIGYVQLCDGPRDAPAEDYGREGLFDRLPPGEGAFPLDRLLGVAPSDLPLSVEIPCRRLRAQGLAGRDLAAEIIGRTRAWLRT